MDNGIYPGSNRGEAKLMLYNRKIYNGDRTDFFTILEIIYRHYDYKKGSYSMSKFMEDDSQRSKDHRRRLYNLVQQIQDWRDREKIKGESEYIVKKFIKNYYESEVE